MMEQIELVRPTWTCSACKSELPYERRTVIAHKRACINTKQQSPSSLSSEKYRLGAMESHFDHSAPSLMEKPKSLPLSTFSNSTPANNNLVFKPLDAVLSNDDIRERQRLKIAEKERKKKAMTMTISSLEDHPVKTEENPSQPPPAGFVGYSPHVRKLKLRRTDCMYGSRDILDEESTLCLRAQGLSNGFGYLMYVGDPITGEVLATIRMSFSLFFASDSSDLRFTEENTSKDTPTPIMSQFNNSIIHKRKESLLLARKEQLLPKRILLSTFVPKERMSEIP